MDEARGEGAAREVSTAAVRRSNEAIGWVGWPGATAAAKGRAEEA